MREEVLAAGLSTVAVELLVSLYLLLVACVSARTAACLQEEIAGYQSACSAVQPSDLFKQAVS